MFIYSEQIILSVREHRPLNTMQTNGEDDIC